MTRLLRLLTPTAASLFAGLVGLTIEPLSAVEPDLSKWPCKFCAFPEGADLDVAGGVIWVSGDSAKFGDFTGLDEQGAYLDAQLAFRYWGQTGERWEVLGRNLGLDSQELWVTGGRQGVYELSAFYDQIPRSLFFTTETPFLGVGSDSLTLPANWVPAGNTQDMTALDTTLRPVDIGYDRETLGIGGKYLPWQKLELTAEYRQDKKDGIQIDTGSMLTAISQFTQPLDYTTDQLELAAGYSADVWNLRLGYYGSFFDNGADRLRWETPFNPAPGADVGQLGLMPDNDFHQASLAGGYRFGRHTSFTARLAVGRGEQDDGFLPFTVNPLLAGGPLPQTNLNGKVDTTNIDLRVRSTPFRRVGLTAEYRKNERDNQTSQNIYNYVITDSVPGQAAENLPYSFEQDSYRLSADYRVMRRTRVLLGWSRDDVERDFQARRKTETDRLWARATVGLSARVSGWVELSAEDRDGSGHLDLAQANAPQNPLMRTYNLADRERTTVEGYLSVQPTDVWDFSLSAVFAEDDYDKTLVGLTESDFFSTTVDTSVRIGKTSVYAAYTREEIESTQNGSQQFNTPDWSGKVKDEFDTVVFGLKWPELFTRVDMNLDYTFAKSGGDTNMSVSGARSGFPELRTRLHSIRLYLDYQYRDRITIRAGYWYERYDSTDWGLDSVFPDTVPNMLSLGAAAYNYNVNTVLLSLNYAWE